MCCAFPSGSLRNADDDALGEVPDAIGGKPVRRVGADLDRKSADDPAFNPRREAKRPAVPAEGKDLLQPAELRDTRVGANAGAARMSTA